jgi:hypothetical protein
MKTACNVAAGFTVVAVFGILLVVPVIVQSGEAEVDASADTRAANYTINTSRSNTKGAAAPAGVGDCNDTDDCRVQPGVAPTSANINTSRSNKKGAVAPAGVGDCDDSNDCPVPPGLNPAAVSGASPPAVPRGMSSGSGAPAAEEAATAPAQDYNSSRSNKASAVRDE